MATSGTRTFTLSAADAIEEAYELAGLEYRTGYDGVTARRSMNIMFADWSNRGIQLWEVEQVSLDLVQGGFFFGLIRIILKALVSLGFLVGCCFGICSQSAPQTLPFRLYQYNLLKKSHLN